MKAGWVVKKLGEVCLIKPPKSEARKQLGSSDLVSFVPMKNLGIGSKYLVANKVRPLEDVAGNYTYFAEEDVLLAKITPCFENGKLGIARNLSNGIGFGSSEYIVFRTNESLHNEFLYYFLSREQFREEGAQRMSGAVGHKRVAKDFIENYPIRLPPLPEQRRIVAILDKAFAAISTAKANAEKNLQNARELFESYLQGVFANPGDGWEEKKLGEVCEYDKAPNKKAHLPYVGLEDIESNSGRFIGSTTPKKVKSSTFYFTDEHVLYGRLRPYLNKVLLPSFEGHCSTEIFPIMTKNILYKGYLFYWLISGETVKKINATWTGARMPRANMNAVLGFEIPLPPLPEQKRIVAKLDELSAETKKLKAIYQQKLADLEEMKKSVLQKAFNGELPEVKI